MIWELRDPILALQPRRNLPCNLPTGEEKEFIGTGRLLSPLNLYQNHWTVQCRVVDRKGPDHCKQTLIFKFGELEALAIIIYKRVSFEKSRKIIFLLLGPLTQFFASSFFSLRFLLNFNYINFDN